MPESIEPYADDIAESWGGTVIFPDKDDITVGTQVI
jgi:hypothetical protein